MLLIVVTLSAICVMLLIIVGYGVHIMQEEINSIHRKKNMKKKERQIEKTSSSDLVAESASAASHRRRKEKICDDFRVGTDAILADVLRSSDKDDGSANPGRG